MSGFRLALFSTIAWVGAAGLSTLAVAHPAREAPQYQPTGERVRCLSTSRIENTKIIDDQHILFHTAGHETFINRLPRRCRGLQVQGGFTYTLRGLDKLCDVDVVTPVETGAVPSGPCPLGQFDRVTKAKK